MGGALTVRLSGGTAARALVALLSAILLTPGVARGWDSPVTVVGEGNPVLEDVGLRGEGDAVAVWLMRVAESELWASRYRAGQWGSGVPLHQGPDSVFFARLADDGRGRTFVVYAVVSYPLGFQEVAVFAREFDGGSWSAPTRLGSGSSFDGGLIVAAGPDGSAMAVFAEPDWSGSLGLWAARYDVSLGWTAAESLGVTSGFADVAVDEAGRATVAWSRHGGESEGLWATRFDPARGWTPPEQVDPGIVQKVRVAMAQGRALAAWTQNGEFGSRILQSLRDPVTGWSTPQRLSFNPEIDANWLPGADLEVATDPAGDGVAVIRLLGSTEESVWTAEIASLGIGSPRRMAPVEGADASIGVNTRGEAAIAWIDGTSLVARVRAASQRWCPAHVFGRSGEGGHFASPEILVDEAGGVLVVWTEFDEDRLIVRSSQHNINTDCASVGMGSGETAVVALGIVALSAGAAASVVLLLRRHRQKGERA